MKDNISFAAKVVVHSCACEPLFLGGKVKKIEGEAAQAEVEEKLRHWEGNRFHPMSVLLMSRIQTTHTAFPI